MADYSRIYVHYTSNITCTCYTCLYRSIESHQNDMEELLKQKELDIKNIVLKHETERKVHVPL